MLWLTTSVTLLMGSSNWGIFINWVTKLPRNSSLKKTRLETTLSGKTKLFSSFKRDHSTVRKVLFLDLWSLDLTWLYFGLSLDNNKLIVVVADFWKVQGIGSKKGERERREKRGDKRNCDNSWQYFTLSSLNEWEVRESIDPQDHHLSLSQGSEVGVPGNRPSNQTRGACLQTQWS